MKVAALRPGLFVGYASYREVAALRPGLFVRARSYRDR
jgi:hypothetical protein